MANRGPALRPVESPQEPEAGVRSISREVVDFPRRAREIELVGQMQDTAFVEGQWLICWGDSNYIQSTKLLYHVLLYSDGCTPLDRIAERVSHDTQIELTSEQVEWLILNRLAPSGLLDLSGPRPAGFEEVASNNAGAGGGHGSAIGEANALPGFGEMPLLGIRYRLPLFPYRLTEPLTSILQHLYWPPLIVIVLVVAIAINLWIAFQANVWSGVQSVLFNPELALVLIGLELAMTLFHELGHAAALRRAGSRYGSIGFAIYIIWPVFYTDVTHVYRLKRADRLRVDIGGMYFQLVGMIVLFGAYAVTEHAIFLLAILLATASFFGQFSPFLRFDGYYIVADVMGVHEPLSLIGPFLRDQLPWPRNRQRQLPPMKRFSKIVFLLYLFAVLIFLTYPFAIGAVAGEKFVRNLVDSGQALWSQLINAWSIGDAVGIVVAALQLGMWFLVPLGLVLFAYTIVRQFMRALRVLAGIVNQWTASIPFNRRTRVWFGVAQLFILLAGAGFYAVEAGVWQSDNRVSVATARDLPAAAPPTTQVSEQESAREPTVTSAGTTVESTSDLTAVPSTEIEEPEPTTHPTEVASAAIASPVPTATVQVPTETPVASSTSGPQPAPVADPAVAIVDHVLAAEQSLVSGEITAEIQNLDGSRSIANLRFDFGADDGPSFQQVATYTGSDASRTDEWITVGAQAWQRQPDGVWVQMPEQEGVLGRLSSYLPSSTLAVESGVTIESESQDEVILRLYDAARDSDVVLTVRPNSGVPLRLTRAHRKSGSVLTVHYHTWNSPVQIVRPDG